MVNNLFLAFFSFIIFFAVALPIGGDCSLGSIYCGSNSTLELLTCDPSTNTCKGIYQKNNCSANFPCASTFFCNDGVCDNCLPNCGLCTNSAVCVTCSLGYWPNSGVCVPLPSNCLIGLNGTYCNNCSSGYFQLNGICCPCPANCNQCSSGTVAI